MKAILWTVDGGTAVVEWSGRFEGEDGAYQTLGVDMIQQVGFGRDLALLIDEEGKLKSDAKCLGNAKATRWADRQGLLFEGDYVAGSALLVRVAGDGYAGLTSADLKAARAWG